MATRTTLRIHPGIGVARCGNSDEFILSPETSAGMPQSGKITGGLPIRSGTEDTPITDSDLRDKSGRLKPHAQRFRIYAYAQPPDGTYPCRGEVTEITVGSAVDGKTVDSITWQVHMANKKANSWLIPESATKDGQIGAMAHYADGTTPPLRNRTFGGGAHQDAEIRLATLVLDAGPKLIDSRANAGQRIGFDAGTPCAYVDASGAVHDKASGFAYPVQFPDGTFTRMYLPTGDPLDSLGGMETDAKGRLMVIGGPGYAASWEQWENTDPHAPEQPISQPFQLSSDIDNDGWMDDAADGPITAVLHFEDGSCRVIDSPAWCICADPAYAPQIRNVVTVWDESYNTWVRSADLNLAPQLFDVSTQEYKDDYQPAFDENIWPIFRAAHLQMFTTGLNQKGIGVHQRLGNFTADTDPAQFSVKDFIRPPGTDPDDNDLQDGAPFMPLSLGHPGASFMTVTDTQYFMLDQWAAKKFTPSEAETLTAGEMLDRVTLQNLLGGRFSPGIDLTFIVLDPMLYNTDWKDPDVGPFRIGAKPLDYGKAAEGTPFLTVGYTPNRQVKNSVEPGDLCKFMALPWHTDYNSCATHLPSPNPEDGRNTTLYWSWPAQRPVSVYTYDDYVGNGNRFFGGQHFSVRGTGTLTRPDETNEGPDAPENAGRYQERLGIIENWMDIGVTIQGQAIEGFVEDPDHPELFLEVQSRLTGPSDVSQPWPILTTDKVYREG